MAMAKMKKTIQGGANSKLQQVDSVTPHKVLHDKQRTNNSNTSDFVHSYIPFLPNMKTSALLVAATVASASAFAPAPQGQSSTALNESLFKTISNMDLFAPKKDQNAYGARKSKGVATSAKLSDRSYVPAGLTKAQYEQIRADADKKKAANYDRNVKKAGVFTDYTAFYTKRGTDEGGSWMKAPNRGHDMAKTKYDWSGETNQAPQYTGVGKIFGKK